MELEDFYKNGKAMVVRNKYSLLCSIAIKRSFEICGQGLETKLNFFDQFSSLKRISNQYIVIGYYPNSDLHVEMAIKDYQIKNVILAFFNSITHKLNEIFNKFILKNISFKNIIKKEMFNKFDKEKLIVNNKCFNNKNCLKFHYYLYYFFNKYETESYE